MHESSFVYQIIHPRSHKIISQREFKNGFLLDGEADHNRPESTTYLQQPYQDIYSFYVLSPSTYCDFEVSRGKRPLILQWTINLCVFRIAVLYKFHAPIAFSVYLYCKV